MFFKILILLILPLFLFSQEEKLEKILAFNTNLGKMMKYQNSGSALKTWIKKVTSNNNTYINLKIYDNNENMLNDYFNKKIDILVFTPYDYVKNIEKFKSITDEYWFMKKDMKYDFHKKYLIVNSNINSLLDLKDKKIAINSANKISKFFLEKTYIEKTKKSAKKVLDNIDFLANSSILLKTYFGSYDASVVDSYEYETMLELNPSITKKIKILEESPRIFNNMIIAFRNNSNMEDYKLILKDFLLSKDKIEVFNLLKIKTIVPDGKNMNKLDEFYFDYMRLKKTID